jgi:hypothetical protein
LGIVLVRWFRLDGRIPMRAIVAIAVAFLTVSCGASSTPCTTCPTISGTYHVTSAAVAAESSTCSSVSYGGYDGDLTITQNGSAITLYTSWFSASGTLYVGDSLSCTATKVQTSWGAFADTRISGAITGQEGSRNLSLHFYFSAVTSGGDRCSLGASMNGVQTSK